MREIKFRAWCEFLGVFAYFENGEYWYDYEGKHFDNGVNAFNWKNAEQYTGLKDENGKEIYEGDIVKIFIPTIRPVPYVCEIYFNQHIAAFEGKTKELTYELFLCDNSVDNAKPEILKIHRSIEIIGNIHETPEILKGK